MIAFNKNISSALTGRTGHAVPWIRLTFAMLLLFGLVLWSCSNPPPKNNPGTDPVRNDACMVDCRAQKCAAYAGCREKCEQKGMNPAIVACNNQCDIKFRYCEDACTTDCGARHPVSLL